MAAEFDLGIVGLGVMGRSLALNFERNGYSVIGYDLAPHLPDNFRLTVAQTLQELAAGLKLPRKILLMVPAGSPVEAAVTSLASFLQPGDIIIDGGNSFFVDTEQRVKQLAEGGIAFVGMGVSGGESGALWGPSLMPGGNQNAWQHIQPMLTAIAAKADDGRPCVTWVGSGGAGHYVKMVHNGIEYADMQLIAEIYDLLHRGVGVPNRELAAIFSRWNEGDLKSYLIEITAQILSHVDTKTGKPLVELILDEAAQKGTGKWASQNSFDVGVAIPTINAAVESRLISALKTERSAAAKVLGSSGTVSGDRDEIITAAGSALFASKVTSYAQGFSLMRAASLEYGWNLDLAEIARIWRAGCIIRAALLDEIAAAYEREPQLVNLLVDPFFSRALLDRQNAWRQVVVAAVQAGIPMPATSASLAYFDAYRSERLPANLIQAQRDFFGAHTYRRIDREGSFHTEWDSTQM